MLRHLAELCGHLELILSSIHLRRLNIKNIDQLQQNASIPRLEVFIERCSLNKFQIRIILITESSNLYGKVQF